MMHDYLKGGRKEEERDRDKDTHREAETQRYREKQRDPLTVLKRSFISRDNFKQKSGKVASSIALCKGEEVS